MLRATQTVIRNTQRLVSHGLTAQAKKARRDVLTILEQVLLAIDPLPLTMSHLDLRGDRLIVAKTLAVDLSRYRNMYVVGAGKAAYRMALAMESVLASRITSGWITIPARPKRNDLRRIAINVARHPTPNRAGVAGSTRIRSLLEQAGKDDLIFAVMSGGGSALMPLPAEGITLSEKIRLTSLLLKTAATINEVNVVRKHISAIKGGQCARYAYPATVVALYMSDIVDDPIDLLASGPTAPDPSTFSEAIDILKRYGLWGSAPKSISTRLALGEQGAIPETPKPSDPVFRTGTVHNVVLANHYTACRASAEAGTRLGYHVLPLTSHLQGEAREVAKVIAAIGKQVQQYGEPVGTPGLVIASGETSVNVRGKGQGGRMQELGLAGLQHLREGMTLAAFSTDGVDGITPRPVAGVIVDVGTTQRGRRRGLDLHGYLADNDSYAYFRQVGEHILTGPTGTNVGDLILLAVH